MNCKKTKKLSNGLFVILGLLSLVLALGTGCGGGGGGGGLGGPPEGEITDPPDTDPGGEAPPPP